MMISLEFITGVAVGIEFIDKAVVTDDETGWFLVVDLFIIRVVFDKLK